MESNKENEFDKSIAQRVHELGLETNPNFVAGLIDTFLLDSKKRLDILSKSLEEKNAKVVYFEAHSLRGASMVLGANSLAAALFSIEEPAMEGKLDGLRIGFENVLLEFRKTEKTLLTLKEREIKR